MSSQDVEMVQPEVGNISPTRCKGSEPYCGNYEKVMNGTSTQNGTLVRTDSNENHDLRTTEYIPLRERVLKKIQNKDPFFSLEFFPPKTANGVVNFLTRLDRFADGGPEFVDITWHMGSEPGNTKKETSSSSIAGACLNYGLVDTMLHVTCAQYTKEETITHLYQAKDIGLRNILALRGDLPQEDENRPIYKYRALDMVKWIKEEFGDYFTICVSGYPSGHPDAPSYAADLMYVKAKCDAGADFIITQLFFEEDLFRKFVRDCREIGITVPIIPGIMPIQSFENIRRIAQLSKLTIPQFVLDAMEPIKNNDEAIRNYGIWLSVKICKNLLESGMAPSFHMYTLNREAATRDILQQIGLWGKHAIGRMLPWKRHCGHPTRIREDVRPVHWSVRPKSYIYRTKDWDDFPNGRWGNSSSPAYGDLKDYYLFYLKGQKAKEDLLKMWGHELKTEQDVWTVFYNFITGKEKPNGAKVTRLPWNETETDMSKETLLVKDELAWCNQNGILTINSQPNVNGAPSSDPLVGWGQPGGYCYQKAYVEFFVSRKNADTLLGVLESYPRVNYHVINRQGDIDQTNAVGNVPMALTWGVFPGSEIAQPTVIDPISFRVWKDEAFDTWTQWANLYPESSPSHSIVKNIRDTYCLVTLVDNDYPQSCCLWEVLEKMINETK